MNADLDATVASLKPGEVSPVIQVGPTKLAVAAVTNIKPAKPATLAEVGDQIRENLINKKVSTLTEQRMRETTEKLKGLQSSGDLKAIAKAIGGEVEDTQLFTHDGAADGIGPASVPGGRVQKPVGAM